MSEIITKVNAMMMLRGYVRAFPTMARAAEALNVPKEHLSDALKDPDCINGSIENKLGLVSEVTYRNVEPL